jgi:hypothetical protein
LSSQNLYNANPHGHVVQQNNIKSILSTAASVVIGVIEVTQSITKFMIDAIFVFLKQVYEIASIIIKSIYEFWRAIANDPVVIYVTRTLIAEPMMAAANFIGTVYLGAYAFITNRAIKYYLFITYLMPVIQYFVWIYRSIRTLFWLIYSNSIQYFLRFVILWPVWEANKMIEWTLDSVRAILGNNKIRFALLLPFQVCIF